MINPCLSFVLQIIGLIVTWFVAITIAVTTGGLAALAALVAAGIISLFVWKYAVDAYNNCRRR